MNRLALSLSCQLLVVISCVGFGVCPTLAQFAEPEQSTSERKALEDDSETPYQITARIHVQADSDQGYLVVQVALKPGMHVYSLTQTGDIPPTQLILEPSKQFRAIGKFTPDKPPKVVLKDPVFGQRVEKHVDSIQFFAPIQVNPGVAPEDLTARIRFKGQVCSQETCVPVFNRPVVGKFAGFFQRSANAGSGNRNR